VHPSELADHYFAAVRARDLDAFMALFAEDAVLVAPDGTIHSGAASIREMEQRVFTIGAPTPSPVAIVIGENSVAVEIDVRLPDGRILRMADFFHLNKDGLIQTLSVYRQG
jgi:ketosteroid isomerase-like protein